MHSSYSTLSCSIGFILIISLCAILLSSDIPRPISISHRSNFGFLPNPWPARREVQAVLLENCTSTSNATIDRPKIKIGPFTYADVLEEGLARSRAAIRRAALSKNVSLSSISKEDGLVFSSQVYRNPAAFLRSYMEMEKKFKIYVYAEGEPPLVHDGPCKDLYTIEGRFIHELDLGNSTFRTKNARRAHLYFMPFSVAKLVKLAYHFDRDLSPIYKFVHEYIKVISTKHPFWNRTQGSDHFMLSCHDWGPYAARVDPYLHNSTIHALCNANASEGFDPRRDVSIPEICLYTGALPPQFAQPLPETALRPHLAFFAGGLHGPIRPVLLQHWGLKDEELLVYSYLPKGLDYYTFMLNSKFCLCPSGFEVASPRIVEAIYSECVPVIISESYVLPFSDVLRWEEFSIHVGVEEIPMLKEKLKGITEEEYESLKEGVKAVKPHFTLNKPAKRFDAFHMILHSIWLRRLNARLRHV